MEVPLGLIVAALEEILLVRAAQAELKRVDSVGLDQDRALPERAGSRSFSSAVSMVSTRILAKSHGHGTRLSSPPRRGAPRFLPAGGAGHRADADSHVAEGRERAHIGERRSPLPPMLRLILVDVVLVVVRALGRQRAPPIIAGTGR